MTPEIVVPAITGVAGIIVGVILGGYVTWKITKRGQNRQIVQERVAPRIDELLRRDRDYIESWRLTYPDKLREYSDSLEYAYLPRRVRKRLARYYAVSDRYNRLLADVTDAFLERLHECLLDEGIPVYLTDRPRSGQLITVRWL